MSRLTDLPSELLHHVLVEVETANLAALSLCCRSLHVFIRHNKQIFRDIYIRKLDDPEGPAGVGLDYEEELKKVTRLEKILAYGDLEKKTSQLPFVADVVTNILRRSSPNQKPPSRNTKLLTSIFASEENRDAMLGSSTLFHRLSGNSLNPQLSFKARQASAKLHTLYGIPISHLGRTRSSRTYPYACSIVYDLRNYTVENFWGPFLDGGDSVNWEKLEAIMLVLGYNSRKFSERMGGFLKLMARDPWVDAVRGSYVSDTFPSAPRGSLEAEDPYNISGTWLRIVCFLDYTELFAYNFGPEQPASNEPRLPLDTTEAIRLIIMEVTVTKIEAPGPNDGQDYPVVYFLGTSRSLHPSWDPNTNSSIRGIVRMTKEGEVRWTSISSYHGEERWRSEGVQVGGIRSARGVFGSWFDEDYDHHGPAGPTAFWKTSDIIRNAEDDKELELNDDEDDEDMDFEVT